MAGPADESFDAYSVRLEDSGGEAVVFAAGDLDLAAADELRDRLREAAARHGRVILDLTEVKFIDGTGLGAVVAARKDAGDASAIVLRHPSPLVMRVLRLTQLDQTFPIEP